MGKTKLIPFDVNKAKNGAQVVTRCGYSAEVKFHNVKVFPPIICLVEMEGKKKPYAYALDGKYTESSEDSDMDLFIKEDVTVKTSNEIKDILPKDIKIEPDKWYVCQSTNSSNLGFKGIKDKFWFIEGRTYSGTDILYWSSGFTLENYEHYFRPWSIFDARPGDVLASADGQDILIFRNIDPDNSEEFYAYFDIRDRGNSWNAKCFKPATKEQCTQIYKKIKDKGYM